MRTKLAICAALALATSFAFSDVRNAGFLTFDDDTYVTGSPHVRNGLTLDGLRWSLTAVVSANWHPVTLWSHMLDVELFGLDPAAHHATGLAFHVANTLLVFLLFARMTGAVWRSAFIAALFGLHPVHVESVAWISERKDVLSTLFWLGSLHAWVSYVRSASRPMYALSLGLLCIGLLSKSMLVTLPFVLLLFDVWPLSRLPMRDALKPSAVWPLLREKLPFFLAAFAIAAGALFTQSRSGPMWSVDVLPIAARAANALVSYARYLGHVFWPVDLTLFYPHPLTWPVAMVAGAAVLLVVVSWAAWRFRERAPWALVGWLFFAGTLLPTIGLVQVGNQALADRYLYVPLLGILWTATWAVSNVLAERRLPLAAIAASVLITCAALTLQSVVRWRDTRALFEHAIAVTGPNPTAQATVAFLDLQDGQADAALERIDEAIRLEPRYAKAHAYRALIQAQRGQLDDAIASYQRSSELRPHPESFFALGRMQEEAGDLSAAETSYRRGLELRADAPEVENRLGRIRARRRDLLGAIAIFDGILTRHPGYAQAHESLGVVYEALGHDEEAVRHYTSALANGGAWPYAQRALGWIRASHPQAELRSAEQAVKLGEAACTETGYRDASDLDLLAAAYAEAGRFDDAVRMAERARAATTNERLAREVEHRAALYRTRQAYRRDATPRQAGGGD